MKKIIYLLMVLGLVFTTACNPMDEIYDELGSEEAVISGDAVYTLTDDDYADLKIPNGFTSADEAKSLLPNFLASLYPVWGKDSSVLVEYKMADGASNLEEINAYANAGKYSLTMDDYIASGSDVMGFYPDAKPSDFLDDILADNLEGQEGDIVLVKYAQYTEDPIITTTTNFSLADDFDYGAVAGDLTTITTEWTGHSGASPYVGYDPTTSLSMADYPSSDIGGSVTIGNPGGEDINRGFTPITSGIAYASTLVNFSAVATGDYFLHFMDDGTNFRGRVGVKSDGNGKMLFGIGASSSSLTYGTTAFDFGTTYLVVASYNIDNGTSNLYVLTTAPATEPGTPEATNTGSSGTTIERVAIRQDFSDGPTGTLDGIRVATTWNDIMVDDIVTDVQGEKEYTELYYMYNGTYWNPSIGVYYLSTEDYDSMGTASGQPGRYNNFDNSILPNNYIPAFLTLKYPFAQESDLLIVMYKYYAGGSTSVKGNAYSVLDGMWQGSSPSLQFGHDGTKWVPDNTIKYVLTSADYELVGNGYYNNFDVRAGKAEETIEVRLEKINTILLKNFPGSAEGQKYNVFYNVYSGANEVWNTKVILKGSAYVLQE